MRKVVVLGASANPLRYSYKAVVSLQRKGFQVVPLGLRSGQIGSLQILTGNPDVDEVDILLLYMNPDNQKKYYDYIFSIKPKTIVFNPGTENFDFAKTAREKGIAVIFDCAINMLEDGIL